MRSIREEEFRQWKASIEESGEISVATSYDVLNGWRVAIGSLQGKMLMMTHNKAKDLAEKSLLTLATRDFPENIQDVEPLKAHYNDVLSCANECRLKNRDKVIPEGYAQAMLTMGSA